MKPLPTSVVRKAAVAATLPLAALAGCESTGPSPREAADRNLVTETP